MKNGVQDHNSHVMLAEAAGQGDAPSVEDVIGADSKMLPTSDDDVDEWCCMQCVLSLQEDFQTEKPLIQSIIEDAGHVCLFLPQFHCELNPIEMLWGYGKHCTYISLEHMAYALPQLSGYCNLADGRFVTMKVLVPQCLDKCKLITVRKFFWKCWRCLDAYRKGLNAHQAALANKKYKSYQKIGLPSDVTPSVGASDA